MCYQAGAGPVAHTASIYRGGEIVKSNVCGQSERGEKESDLIRKRACLDEDCRRVWPAEAEPGA